MGLRDRRRGGEEPARRYQMREKLLSVGDDYWIEDESGQRAFKVDGKAVRVRDTFVLRDASGQEVAKMQERKLRVRESMEIEHPGATQPFTRPWSVSGPASRSTRTMAST
jgi:uncharacterized protein YxjI